MMQLTHQAMSVFVLAGGRSTRMGEDKALVAWRGQTLLARALQVARELTPEVVIVGDKDKYAPFGRVVEDIFPGRGPLGGIHSALAVTATELNLILAVDLPLVETGFLSYLCHRALGTEALVVVPHAAGGWQPLCALYRKKFARAAEEALKAGHNKIDSLFSDIPIVRIEEKEIAGAGFSLDMFRNVNTPDELREASR